MSGAPLLAPKARHNDRRCVATGSDLPAGAFAIRFARAPDGTLVPDLTEKLPGRGAWLSADQAALALALKKGAFARSFRTETRLPEGSSADDFAAALDQQLRARALAQLGLARRAGLVVTGADTVKRSARRLTAYLHPVDAAPDSVRKIRAQLEAPPQTAHIILRVDADALGRALGDVGIVHIGLLPGRVSATALWEVQRWSAFSATDADQPSKPA